MTNVTSYPTHIPNPESARLGESRRHCVLSEQFRLKRRSSAFQCVGPNQPWPRIAVVARLSLHSNRPPTAESDPFGAAVTKASILYNTHVEQ